MPLWQAIVTDAILAVVIAQAVWFVLGGMLNRRYINRYLQWVRQGTAGWGGKPSWQSIGSSGFSVKIEGAKPPFRRAELALTVLPREILLGWAYSYLRGRRDAFVFKADLAASPEVRLELFRARGRFVKEGLRGVREQGWQYETVEGRDLLLAYDGPSAPPVATALVDAAAAYTPYLWRLAVRPTSPHLLVAATIPPKQESAREELFQWLDEVVEQVAPAGAARSAALRSVAEVAKRRKKKAGRGR